MVKKVCKSSVDVTSTSDEPLVTADPLTPLPQIQHTMHPHLHC